MPNAYAFDTETTSKDADREIIEAAYTRLMNADDLSEGGDGIRFPLALHGATCLRFKPARPITCGSVAVHGILPSDLADCPPSSSFALPADCDYIVGHSVDFDWDAAGKPNVKRICTHAMSQHVFPDADSHSLVGLIYMLRGLTPETRAHVRGAHSADHDVEMCAFLLQAILELRPEIRTWSALWEFSEECRIPRTCPMKKYEGVLLADLDDGFIDWCLRQDWLDPYYRIGLERVMTDRYAPANPQNATPKHDNECACDACVEVPF